jgi:branched-chain amino acid transport system substrate-binding protein
VSLISKKALTKIHVAIIIVVFVVAALGAYAWVNFFPLGPKENEVRVGVLTPLTGAAAYFGEGQKAMALWMADRINKEGGIKSLGGLKIRVIIADTEGKPEVGKAQASRLITEEKVHVIIGALHSGVTLPAAQEAERYGIPFICETSSHPDLTRQGFKWFFRVWGSDAIFARNYFEFMKWLKETKGYEFRTIAIVAEESLFSVGVATEWEKLNLDSTLGGYQIVANIRHPVSPTDLTTEALALKQANPDIVLLTVTPIPSAILWTQALKQVNFFPKALLTCGGFIFPEYLRSVGADGEYVIGREGWSIDLMEKKPIAKQIAEAFTNETGKDMTVYTTTMHAAFVVLRDALERAGSLEPEKIRQALIETNIPGDKIIPPWQGIKFDATGQNIYAMNFMVQAVKGQWRIIWPEEIATVDVIFPAPSWNERAG